jgi:hypothetical protein
VFIDESGLHTSMTRLRARAPKGERAYGRVPRNRGKNQTLIASVTLQGGMGAALSIEGSTDSELFETYVEELLAPTLTAGQVVVLDKLGAHRTERVRELVEERGRMSKEPFFLRLLRRGDLFMKRSILLVSTMTLTCWRQVGWRW